MDNIDDAKIEIYIGEYKPDIALLKQGRPTSIIEIIVTHEPQNAAEKYYASNGVSVIKISLESDEDIYDVFKDPLIPPKVEYCIDLPRCPRCSQYMYRKYLCIGNYECWNCGETYKVAWVTLDIGRSETYYGPEGFSENEIEIARQNGVRIEQRYSKTVRETYNTNVCPRCGNILGKFFIHNLLYTEEEKIFIGYECLSCGIEKRSKP